MARERPKLSAKKWAETADSGFTPSVVKLPEGVSFFTPKKAGTYRLEIIPYVVPEKPKGGPNPNAQGGELHYERTFFSHRGIGADEKSYVCPAKTAGKPCPICEHRKELMRDKDADEDLIKALAPKQRQLWNIYDHGEPDKGVQVWEVSFHLFGKQLKAAVLNSDEDDKFEYFADPEDGMTLRVGMEEKSFGGNTFLEAASISFKPRKTPLSDEILDAAHPLDDLLILFDYDKLKSIFLQEEGIEHPADDDDDDEPAPKKDKKSAPADDDDDDDEPAPKKEKKPADKPKEELKKEAKPVTAAELGIGKGDDCRFGGKNWMIIKVAEDGLTVTLSNDDDDIRKGVPVADLQPPVGTDANEEKKPDPTKGTGKPSTTTQTTAGSTSGKPAKDDEDWDNDEPAQKKETKQESKAKEKQTDKPKEEVKKDSKSDKDENWDDWD